MNIYDYLKTPFFILVVSDVSGFTTVLKFAFLARVRLAQETTSAPMMRLCEARPLELMFWYSEVNTACSSRCVFAQS